MEKAKAKTGKRGKKGERGSSLKDAMGHNREAVMCFLFFFLHSRKRAYMRNRDAALLADLQERKQRKVRDAKSPPKEEYTLVCLCLT